MSHISSRYPGLVEAAINFAAANLPLPAARVPRVLASGLRTRSGGGKMLAPAIWPVALHEGAERAAAGDGPRRTLGLTLGAPNVLPRWLELDRNERVSGPSHAAAAPCR